MLRKLLLTALVTAATFYLPAQAPSRPIRVVTWFGPGAIPTPTTDEWKLDLVNVYDEGQRPDIQFSNAKTAVTVSFLLYENHSGTPTAEGCRKDAIDPIFAHDGASITGRVDSLATPLALTSYFLPITPKVRQRNLFAFAGDAHLCAEMHASKVEAHGSAEKDLQQVLTLFHPELTYDPDPTDELLFASLLFHSSPGLAAPYYKAGLDKLPADNKPSTVNLRRIATDQLVMSLGISGDLKSSRAVANNAIQQDPDYPLNYYNLACADAEEGNASAARTHLEQAFARKANTLPGEKLPNPSKDDSILKLKSDKAFWGFVQTLH